MAIVTADDWMTEWKKRKEVTAREARKMAFFLMTECTATGIKTIHISFEGSGDDGSIHEVLIDGEDKTPEWGENTGNDPLAQRVTDWAYKFLDGTGVDWVNNDGGFGFIDFDVVGRKIKFEVNRNVMHAEVAEEGEWEFGHQGGGDEEKEESPSVPKLG